MTDPNRSTPKRSTKQLMASAVRLHRKALRPCRGVVVERLIRLVGALERRGSVVELEMLTDAFEWNVAAIVEASR